MKANDLIEKNLTEEQIGVKRGMTRMGNIVVFVGVFIMFMLLGFLVAIPLALIFAIAVNTWVDANVNQYLLSVLIAQGRDQGAPSVESTGDDVD